MLKDGILHGISPEGLVTMHLLNRFFMIEPIFCLLFEEPFKWIILVNKLAEETASILEFDVASLFDLVVQV